MNIHLLIHYFYKLNTVEAVYIHTHKSFAYLVKHAYANLADTTFSEEHWLCTEGESY